MVSRAALIQDLKKRKVRGSPSKMNNDRLADTLEVRDSDFGVGLFAKEDLPAGFSVHYFGKFYPDSEAVEDANLDNGQYVIAQSSNSHHVDGLAVKPSHKVHQLPLIL